ncbi:MAG: hypothetical protein EOM37_17720 [Proteobacteria bacterium]|nr:hypothetical protein [Pseudomonadota bacterium]
MLTQSPALHATIQLYEASEGVPARLKVMATPDRVPRTTTDASPKQHKPVSPQPTETKTPPTETSRSGGVMVLRRVGCLTEPGIVC